MSNGKQVLAVDLLNPAPAAEVRRHKLKVRSRRVSPAPISSAKRTSYLDPRIRPAELLHGRQMPGLLHNHDRVLARPDGGGVCRLLAGAVPADGRQGAADGGVLVPQEMSVEVVREGGYMCPWPN
jgi:hypothetical protein